MATAQSQGKVLNVGQTDFDQIVLKSDVPVLADFYADWCGPCRALAPVLAQLAREVPDAKVVKVNVDDNPDLAIRYRINAIPALMAFEDGQVTDKQAGMAGLPRLKSMLGR